MTEVPADWHPDPTGRHEYRYWDGQSWTEYVSDAGQFVTDPLEQPSTPGGVQIEVVGSAGVEEDAAQSAVQTDVAPDETVAESGANHLEPTPGHQISAAASEKVTAFNAKRIATELQRDNQRLFQALSEFGALDAPARRQRIEDERTLEEKLGTQIVTLRHEVEDLEGQVIALRDRLDLEAVGMFDFEHAAEQSPKLAATLESLRARIRESNKVGTAITATTGFTFNNSTAQGKKFVAAMSRIMLRSYNAEAENAVKTVRAGNLAAAQKRLETARAQIAKQGQMIDLSVTDYYHWLRSQELRLAAEHLQAVQAAKELEHERRAELREQRLLEAEIRREKERLDKERTHYLNSIQRLRESGDDQGAAELQAELDRIDAEIAQADYRAANIRAGYVYVISNIGAFGQGTVKIGMTRRLDPMDRVRELGDASVPFQFVTGQVVAVRL